MEALIEDGDNYMLRTIPETGRFMGRKMLRARCRVDGDNLSGEFARSYRGDMYASVENVLESTSSDKRKQLLEKIMVSGAANMMTDTICHGAGNDSAGEVSTVSARGILRKAAQHIGDALYIDCTALYDGVPKAVETAGRPCGLELGLPYASESEIAIAVPEGYGAEKLPADYKTDNEWFSAAATYRANSAGKIVANFEITYKATDVPKDKLGEWNVRVRELRKTVNTHIKLIKNKQYGD